MCGIERLNCCTIATIKENFMNFFRGLGAATALAFGIAIAPVGAAAQAPFAAVGEAATYADLVTLAERSQLVARAQIRRQTQLRPERAPGLAPGFARLYIEAETIALIAGDTALGEQLVYLVDVPLNENGKPPKLKKQTVLLFANLAGRGPKGATQLQLTGRQAQIPYSPAFEARLRPVLTALAARDVPPVITAVSDALSVPGTLSGESETQIFLKTSTDAPVSITVLRRPGQPPRWGVSWGEIIDSAARPPAPETLRWYRLACALPDQLPASANISQDPATRRLATRDYAFVREALGPCARAITAGT
jgi:hypothetical protein